SFGALRLTKAATPLLRGEHQLHLREDPGKRERNRHRKDDTHSNDALPPAAEARFDALRQWRSNTAREQNVPAYVIFHDATLRSIAQHHPHTLTALATISGVGAGKLERYGEAVLGVLTA
ncbi:MAG TPA: HRDC domain-containing protein, partial [Thauera sp.]|nr:HRDC domain-containing protein [Thauera sp.]